MTYCGLTNLGMAFELENHPDSKEVELVPLTQLENNLILLDKNTGHIGQQINGVDEAALLEKIHGKSYRETNRRLPEEVLKNANLHGSEMGKEVSVVLPLPLLHCIITQIKISLVFDCCQIPTWRMKLGDFVRTYPEGEVFINDYKMFPNMKRPVKTFCKLFVPHTLIANSFTISCELFLFLVLTVACLLNINLFR